jgi:hypothetical protein
VRVPVGRYQPPTRKAKHRQISHSTGMPYWFIAKYISVYHHYKSRKSKRNEQRAFDLKKVLFQAELRTIDVLRHHQIMYAYRGNVHWIFRNSQLTHQTRKIKTNKMITQIEWGRKNRTVDLD